LIAANNALVGLVVDADTGELRFYNNPGGVVTAFIDPRSDSIGMINGEVNYNVNRDLTSIPAAGQAQPGDIREGKVEYDVTINKVFTARWKTDYTANVPDAVVATDLDPNMLGANFLEAIIDPSSETESIAQGFSPWFLVIVYARKMLRNGTIIGDTTIFPCCKFGDTNSFKYVADGIYTGSLKCKAMGMHHFPKDDYQVYQNNYSPP
jgi:hypothetical protein